MVRKRRFCEHSGDSEEEQPGIEQQGERDSDRAEKIAPPKSPHVAKKEKTERYARKCLNFLAVTTVIFILLQYISFLITGEEQEALISGYFTAVVVECGGLFIKRILDKKHKEEE